MKMTGNSVRRKGPGEHPVLLMRAYLLVRTTLLNSVALGALSLKKLGTLGNVASRDSHVGLGPRHC